MNDSILTALAILVDRCIGDPANLPHPVIWMGNYIRRVDMRLNVAGMNATALRLRGAWLTLSTIGLAAGVTFGLDDALYRVSPLLSAVLQIWLISTTIAWKGLMKAGRDVYTAMTEHGLAAAQAAVGQIVGRDTDRLPESEVCRAAIETLAENLVDGVISPVFYACIGGAPLAMAYRATNTLDSMVGYKNDKYRDFGCVSARTDDVANYIPARITALLLYVVFVVLRMNATTSWTMLRRDAHKHPSPNGGIPESMVAGALGIQLGGVNSYGGVLSHRAKMGDAQRFLHREDIQSTIRIVEAYGWTLWICVALVGGWIWLIR